MMGPFGAANCLPAAYAMASSGWLIYAPRNCPAATRRHGIQFKQPQVSLDGIDGLPDMTAAPFNFPRRYRQSLALLRSGVRTFTTTSVGRLFDTAAALLGFTRQVSFEGQAAIWLEQIARNIPAADAYPFPFNDRELDFRPLLKSAANDRLRGRNPAEISRAFHRGVAQGLCDALAGALSGPWDGYRSFVWWCFSERTAVAGYQGARARQSFQGLYEQHRPEQ